MQLELLILEPHRVECSAETELRYTFVCAHNQSWKCTDFEMQISTATNTCNTSLQIDRRNTTH